MRVLLTNDDGINAAGIQALCTELNSCVELSVVAPASERSATGHGITLRQPLVVKEIAMKRKGLSGFSVSGTPADCVKLAIQGELVPRPDIVISGINQGQNLGTDVLYSGTVSAAIEGALLGVPAVAISLASYTYRDFGYAAEFTRKLCLDLNKQGLTEDTVINVNIPPVPRQQVQGVRVTKLGVIKYTNVFQQQTGPTGQRYFLQGGDILVEDYSDTDTDVYALHNNFVSVTPIHFDLTNYKILQEVKQWNLEK